MRVFDHSELGSMLCRLRRYLFIVEVYLGPLNAAALLVPIVVEVEASMEVLQRVPRKALRRGRGLVQWLASVVCIWHVWITTEHTGVLDAKHPRDMVAKDALILTWLVVPGFVVCGPDHVKHVVPHPDGELLKVVSLVELRKEMFGHLLEHNVTVWIFHCLHFILRDLYIEVIAVGIVILQKLGVLRARNVRN